MFYWTYRCENVSTYTLSLCCAQRFCNASTIDAKRLPAIAEAKKALDAGCSVVIGLQHTGEAAASSDITAASAVTRSNTSTNADAAAAADNDSADEEGQYVYDAAQHTQGDNDIGVHVEDSDCESDAEQCDASEQDGDTSGDTSVLATGPLHWIQS
jgi:hypothetical protein